MTKVMQQMDMTKAAKLFFTNYFDFSGRASQRRVLVGIFGIFYR